MTDEAAPAAQTDESTTVADLKRLMQQFIADRDWSQFHTPKNLSMSLAIEVAELMEHFQWLDAAESMARSQDPAHREAIGDELADVCCYLLSLAAAMKFDLSQCVRAKMIKNARKYPAEQFRGRFGADDPRR